MRYITLLFLVFICGTAQAQIARITRDGTTVYSDNGEIYTPSAQNIARQQEQKRQQQRTLQQQTRAQQEQNNSKQQKIEKMQNNPVMQMSRNLIKNSGDQRTAFNLMILQEVATYKLDDEEIQKEVAGLRNNQEYYRKLDIIKKKLSNSKISDYKNKEVMKILNETGNRLYNLLGN